MAYRLFDFDYLILIALQQDNSNCDFYIFTRKEIEDNKENLINRDKRFKKSPYRILVTKIPQKDYPLTDFDIKLYKNGDYFNIWDKILTTS